MFQASAEDLRLGKEKLARHNKEILERIFRKKENLSLNMERNRDSKKSGQEITIVKIFIEKLFVRF